MDFINFVGNIAIWVSCIGLLIAMIALVGYVVLRATFWVHDTIVYYGNHKRLMAGQRAGYVHRFGTYTDDLAYHHGRVRIGDLDRVGLVRVMDPVTGRMSEVVVSSPKQARRNSRQALGLPVR